MTLTRSNWKLTLVLIAAAVALQLASLRFNKSHAAAAAEQAPASAASHDGDDGAAPSNEIFDGFQQLD